MKIADPAPSVRLHRFLRDRVLVRLGGLRHGRVTLVDGGTRVVLGDEGADLQAAIHVNDPRFWSAVAFGGTVGAGAAYAEGRWDCDDLPSLVRVLVRNREVLDGMEGGLARVSAPLRAAFHALRRNSSRGSRENIEAHYDLGNDFFRLFLDETMTYSCGVFERDEATLAEASTAKLDRLCRKLDLRPHHHLLEIGTGWGSFALHAAARYGCRVTTTTISPSQHRLAVERVRAAGLEDRVEVLLADYRDLTGRYDRIVSIEMVEAVGHRFLDTYFGRCADLLRDDGAMGLQAITIQDQFHRRALKEVDFIQRYIFPGSCIPSNESICSSLTRATDLKLFHLEDIGPHYARTLREWRRRLLAREDDVRALGLPRELPRLWEFYFAYCEGGFEERVLGTAQMLLTKPRCRIAPVLPPLVAPEFARDG